MPPRLPPPPRTHTHKTQSAVQPSTFPDTTVTPFYPFPHPPGCTLASAIAAELAKGLPLLPAVAAARAALLEALRASAPLALGSGVQRPFHHLHMLPVLAPAPAPAAASAAAAAATAGVSIAPPAAPGAGSGAGSGALGRVDLGLLTRQLRLYAVTDPHCNQKAGRCGLRGGAGEGGGGW